MTEDGYLTTSKKVRSMSVTFLYHQIQQRPDYIMENWSECLNRQRGQNVRFCYYTNPDNSELDSPNTGIATF